MGGPREQDDIEPFLKALLSDPAMVRLPFFMKPWQERLATRWAHKRAPKIKERYRQIGGGSPLIQITDKLAKDLEIKLRTGGLETVVRAAYRYGRPQVAQVLDDMGRLGVNKLTQLPLYPHFSHTTTGSSFTASSAALDGEGAHWTVTTIEAWGNEAGYLDLLEEQVRAALASEGATISESQSNGEGTPPVALLCSAHGLPKRYIEAGDPYLEQVTTTFQALSQRLDPLECRLGFQSQMGPVQWLEPTSSQVISNLANKGYRKLLVLPLGFVCDHIETLYDMDLILREEALEAGFTSFKRLPAFNNDGAFVTLLANLINREHEQIIHSRNNDDK